MLTRRHFLASGLLAAIYRPGQGRAASVPAEAVTAEGEAVQTAWRNWSGALQSNPWRRLAPATEDQLVEALKLTRGKLRPVGAGHSFTPLVPTDGTLVVLDKLSGVIAHDAGSNTAVLAAGTRLGDAGPLLDGINQAMLNLPDIDRQTLAGAVATATHGTGLGLGSLSSYVTELRLVTPRGEVLDLSRTSQPDLFNAARVSLGALGIVTRIGFQNRGPFRLRSSTWVEKTADVIESFPARLLEYEHYEFMPFVHADYSLVIAHKETDAAIQSVPVSTDDVDAFGPISKIPVSQRRAVINPLLQLLPATESVEPSFQALTNVRNDRFNEMEYSVPVEAGLACVKEILETISRDGLDVIFPLEYRVVAADDCWLSMFSGSAKATISIHRMASEDYRPYFDAIEPIFWKYGGRPHWGKVHSLGFQELRALYPRLGEFAEIQKELDPDGQMINDHLRTILGLG